MTIWADCDSLAREAREIVARRVLTENTRGHAMRAVFAAARVPDAPRAACVPPESLGEFAPGVYAVAAGRAESATDELIMRLARPGDLVVTRDLPFARRATEAGIACVNDRGDEWTEDTIRERASLRDRMTELRAAGLAPPPDRARRWGEREKAAFANAFDRALARLSAARGS